MTRRSRLWEKRAPVRYASRPRIDDASALPRIDDALARAALRLAPGLRLRLAGGPEAPDPARRSALPRAGTALVRRRRARAHLSRWGIGSGLLHAALLAALFLLIMPKPPSGSPEPPTVEMLFGHAGSAGLQGASVPQDQQGSAPPPVAPAPAPLTPPDARTPPVPDEAVPPPSVAVPPAPPSRAPALPRPSPSTRRPTRPSRAQHQSHAQHHAARTSNPFANMTDLSLAPTPDIERRGRGGSGNGINLSIGPMVRGGKLSMPFSMRGGHGMTSDYESMIDAWVERHKYYPQSAAQRGDDGNVTLHVVWDRNGRVLSVDLLSGSGDDDLDAAWEGLFRGAHLPPPPPDVTGDPISMDMTMHYILIR